MLERLVLKNAADCTSQRVKRTSGARVMICLCLTLIGNCSWCFVFERYELVVPLFGCCPAGGRDCSKSYFVVIVVYPRSGKTLLFG